MSREALECILTQEIRRTSGGVRRAVNCLQGRDSYLSHSHLKIVRLTI